MNIDALSLDPNIINFLKSQGYTKLYPPQEDAVKTGVLDSKSVLVSVPTASGKTLIAMLATLSHLSKNKSKVIYLTPLRALAAEKFEEFKKLEKINGIKLKIKKILVNNFLYFLLNSRIEKNNAMQREIF